MFHNQDFYNRDGKTLRLARNIPSPKKPELKKPHLIHTRAVLQVWQGRGTNGTVPAHPISRAVPPYSWRRSQPGLPAPGPEMPQLSTMSPALHSLSLPSHGPCWAGLVFSPSAQAILSPPWPQVSSWWPWLWLFQCHQLHCSWLEQWSRSWMVFPGEPPSSTDPDGEHIWTTLYFSETAVKHKLGLECL